MYYPTLNIGIEEEYQVIDPQNRELLGYVTQSMSQEQLVVRERTPEDGIGATLWRSGD